MVRKRARRTPKPVITEAKSGRRCDDVPAGSDALCQPDTDADADDYILANVSLKDAFCLVMMICSLNWVDEMTNKMLITKVIVRKSIFDPRGSLGARMSIDIDTGVVSVSHQRVLLVSVLQYIIKKCNWNTNKQKLWALILTLVGWVHITFWSIWFSGNLTLLFNY